MSASKQDLLATLIGLSRGQAETEAPPITTASMLEALKKQRVQFDTTKARLDAKYTKSVTETDAAIAALEAHPELTDTIETILNALIERT